MAIRDRVPDPSAAEIAERSAQVQATWNDGTREAREVIKSQPVSVPSYDRSAHKSAGVTNYEARKR